MLFIHPLCFLSIVPHIFGYDRMRVDMNKEISQIFGKIIKLLEIKGDKALSFKINAYKRAIFILNNLK